MGTISLQEALSRLGDSDTRVDLGGGWDLSFDPELGPVLGRADGRFHRAFVGTHSRGYPCLLIEEEPLVTDRDEQNRRIVGHIVIEVNPNGLIRGRKAAGIENDVLELCPSSISKGELASTNATPIGYVMANCQRLTGHMAVYLTHVDFPNEDGMTPEAFCQASEDGRALAALAKAGLLISS